MSNSTFDVKAIRKDFPILSREVNGKPLVYLDNGASSQKPKPVIDAITNYYIEHHANVHRGVHALSQEATELFEAARQKVADWFNANSTKEIIFTRGTTESINLVAAAFVQKFVHEGDEIIVSEMEHHSNLVPWQLACERQGAVLKVVPMDDNGDFRFSEFEELLSDRTKLVAVNHVSNALGTVNPVKAIIDKAHEYGAKVLVDGAQAVPHMRLDFQELDCDFYAASAHKMYGPTGMGFLYGKEEILNEMPPFMGGGEMIGTVSLTKSTWAELPYKFEAGTPNIADGIAFGEAIDWLQSIDLEGAKAHEKELLAYGHEQLKTIDGMRIIGEAAEKSGVISFLIGDLHPYDVGAILDQMGIAVRTGAHCAEPIMQHFGIPGTIRASFAFYNTKEEIDLLVSGLKRAVRMLS